MLIYNHVHQLDMHDVHTELSQSHLFIIFSQSDLCPSSICILYQLNGHSIYMISMIATVCIFQSNANNSIE